MPLEVVYKLNQPGNSGIAPSTHHANPNQSAPTKSAFFACVILVHFTSACSSITSNTIIKPKDSFILGKNQHGAFEVKLKNVSKTALDVYHAPVDGGKHSLQAVQPGEQITAKVERNTALIIENKSDQSASVDLTITGDTGLSMG